MTTETAKRTHAFASQHVEIAMAESDEFQRFVVEAGRRYLRADMGEDPRDSELVGSIGRYDLPEHLTLLLTGNPARLTVSVVPHPSGVDVMAIRFAYEAMGGRS